MTNAFFFGYGSLVNRKTHSYGEAHRACATGWRRVWRHTALRPVAFLTAIPDPGARIEGLIAGVPNGDWRALDAREHAYDRVDLRDLDDHPLPFAPKAAIYSIPEGKHGAPSMAHPILLSYLDVVVQGYYQEFGEDGVDRFFATTDGWDAPILDDRAAPQYPRHQALSSAEIRLVDRKLDDIEARRVPLTAAHTEVLHRARGE
ncbi:gamma-glutamylcyclotransferase family protein [Thalassovita aquimarina]|uniref:Gamma-glutamylcyclotransferase n=1 Tax=Thalassovita aquimarina TaxID=2785917 RepID=A0ABS5HPX6_9RHOB|nr:gamma-glutamylcyclotransferase family protein [Thalassovita aquimarina]MBR9650638.1 gamma-glutamylcyclotransferase [Thalassovita aquimarina]